MRPMRTHRVHVWPWLRGVGTLALPNWLAITLGLSANIQDDQRLLEAGMLVYDALYTWSRSLTGERHGWNPDQLRGEMNA